MDSRPLAIIPSRLAWLFRPMEAFFSAESSGGIVLIVSALAAMLVANSPWGDAYQHFWHAPVALSFRGHTSAITLHQLVNDGLMVIFFLLVGLEIKRELLFGELASVRKATLPIAAALGGMTTPALIYIAFNAGGSGAPGWGVPMATDIAFAVGVLALAGRAVPSSIKVFLLAIAIVDDLGAVLVIALFYTSHIAWGALGLAGIFFGSLVALNLLGVHRPWPYLLLGVGLWAATLCSGVHATVAGVLLALAIPATRQLEEGSYLAQVRGLLNTFERGARNVPEKLTEEQSHALKVMERAAQAVQTPLARIEHALLRPVNFLIIPLFALANAGVDLRGGGLAAAASPVAWGVFLGLVVGKPLGVLLASWGATSYRLAALPEGATLRHLVGVSVLCGIGFTMSLFVGNLAFPLAAGNLAAGNLAAGKIAILAASLLSGVIGGGIIATARVRK